MATLVPQRDLRNNTAELLRRVEHGEHLTITSHGHPVADLVPTERKSEFLPRSELMAEFKGLLRPDDRLDEELREWDDLPADVFES